MSEWEIGTVIFVVNVSRDCYAGCDFKMWDFLYPECTMEYRTDQLSSASFL